MLLLVTHTSVADHPASTDIGGRRWQEISLWRASFCSSRRDCHVPREPVMPIVGALGKFPLAESATNTHYRLDAVQLSLHHVPLLPLPVSLLCSLPHSLLPRSCSPCSSPPAAVLSSVSYAQVSSSARTMPSVPYASHSHTTGPRPNLLSPSVLVLCTRRERRRRMSLPRFTVLAKIKKMDSRANRERIDHDDDNDTSREERDRGERRYVIE